MSTVDIAWFPFASMTPVRKMLSVMTVGNNSSDFSHFVGTLLASDYHTILLWPF